MRRARHKLLLVPLFWAFLLTSANADSLPPPADKVVLTIDGSISHTTDGAVAELDVAALEALGMWTVETTNPWTEGVTRYEGPLARDVLELVGAQGAMVTALALNDYSSDIPVEDFAKYDVILALKADGVQLSVREKGPIFVVYPFDDHEELRTDVYFSRSVWQLARLTVR